MLLIYESVWVWLMKTIFYNLRYCDTEGRIRPGVLVVEDEKTVSLRHSKTLTTVKKTLKKAKLVDLKNHLILPGAIDGHVHFDDPGFTERENFNTGTKSAAAGGVTCVVDMPCTSIPPVVSKINFKRKLSAVAKKAVVDYMFWGGVSRDVIKQKDWNQIFKKLISCGVAAIKVYMTSGMDTFKDLDIKDIERVLKEAKKFKIPVGVHAEDKKSVIQVVEKLKTKKHSTILDYAKSRSVGAEVSAVKELLRLCKKTKADVHVVHLSSARGLQVILDAKKMGLPMSAETCPHYLAFTDRDLKKMGSLLKTAPVVKKDTDKKRLWVALKRKQLLFVTTDHAAAKWPQEKHTGSPWTDYGGVPGVEFLLPFLFSEGVVKKRISLKRMVELISEAPAQFFGIENKKGKLKKNYDADFVVFDDKKNWIVRAKNMHSLNKYTPFEGWRLKGQVVATYVRGVRVFERDEKHGERFVKAGFGKLIKRA